MKRICNARVGSRARLFAAGLGIGMMALSCSSATPGPDELAFSEPGESKPEETRTTVRWFVGLGTGSHTEQVEAQRLVVANFNAMQSEINLELEIVDNEIAFDVLKEMIADGDIPDIVGPVGIRGANVFSDEFLDLEPLLAAAGTDLSVYNQTQVEVWRQDDGDLVGLPFGVFPSFVYYNTELFDQAGIAPPPHQFGELYEGEPWTVEALSRIAKTLTLDANGTRGDEPGFDPERIVQWGFHHQFINDLRAHGTFFGAGGLVADDGSAVVSDNWVNEWQWYHDMMWKHSSSPTGAEVESPLLDSGNAFNSGNVAMSFTHLWYTGSLRDQLGVGQTFFDLAIVPSYDGASTSKLHADTFGILAGAPDPEAALSVLLYLVGEGAPDLLTTYGSFPARADLRASFLEELDLTFAQKVDWSVVSASLEHPDLPSHEALLPAPFASQELLDVLQERLLAEPDLDVSQAVAELERELQDLFEAESP